MLTEHQSSNYIDLGFTYLADRTSVDGKPIESALDHIYRSVNLEDNTYCNKLEDASTDHLPVKIIMFCDVNNSRINKFKLTN